MNRITYGPTWQKNEDGTWYLPEHTLGWEVLGWCAKWLRQPDGPDSGQAWKFTPEQARFILWWFAVDERGRWVYDYAHLRRSKGWGKDPIAAVLAAVELAGPARFSHFEGGKPVGKPTSAPWVQVAAVSKDQTRNTMKLFPGLLSKEAINAFALEVLKEHVFASGGGAIEAVTSSPRALEGGRSSFVIMNETQHWLKNNDGHEMAEVIARNVTKSRDGSARVLSISNAFSPGEDSVAEHDWEAFLAIDQGRSRAKPFLYDSIEAPPDTDLSDDESLREGIRAARGDSHWLDEDRTLEAILDTRNAVSLSRRFYLNQLAAAEDAWLAPHEWDACAVDEVLAPREAIALGFDGSRTDDSTALVACRISDGLITLLNVWEKPELDDEWEVPREEVDAAVYRAFETYEVQAFFADVHPWETYIDKWNAEYGAELTATASRDNAVAFDMRSKTKDFTHGAEKFLQAVVDGELIHSGNKVLTRHAHNARRKPNRFGVGFAKEHRESSKKVDALAAAVLSYIARDSVRFGAQKPSKQGTAWMSLPV